MDPASIVSLAAACLTLVTRTTRDLNDIVGKFRKMDQKVGLVIAQLNTITATLSRLEAWLKGEEVAEDVAKDLADAINACAIVVTELRNYIKKLSGGWLGGRITWVWDEGQFLQYQSALDSQIAALGLFLNVILLHSSTQRRAILSSTTNRQTLRVAHDHASICASTTADDRRSTRTASIAESSSGDIDWILRSGFSSFTFDAELIDSATYRARLARSEAPEDNENDDTRKKSKKKEDTNPLSPTTAETPSSTAYSPVLPAAMDMDMRPRSDSDTFTVTTTSTRSTASTRSSSGRSPSLIFDFEKSGRRLSWSSRGRQTRLAKELCIAAASGDAAATESLLAQGAEVNCRHALPEDKGARQQESRERVLDRDGSKRSFLQRKSSEPTPLHHAAEKGHLEIVQTLIRHGADIRARAWGGKTALHVAKGGALTTFLVSAGADTSARDDTAFSSSPLHDLAARGDDEAVQAMLALPSAAAADVANSTNKLHQTPLHLACRRNHVETARRLLQHGGAYANAADQDGLRPLHYAARHGNDDDDAALVRALLDAGADVEARAKDLWRPLHSAASAGSAEATGTLLHAASASVDATTAAGFTALHLAVQKLSLETVTVLLDAGANIEAETENQDRPLHLAMQGRGGRRSGVLRLLLERGADVDARCRDGCTCVIKACGAPPGAPNEPLALIKCLLGFNADVNVVNNAGASALEVACSRSELADDVVRLLIAHGVRPRHEDFRALWRNRKLSVWEKRAVHSALNEVAVPELRKNEVEWMIVAR